MSRGGDRVRLADGRIVQRVVHYDSDFGKPGWFFVVVDGRRHFVEMLRKRPRTPNGHPVTWEETSAPSGGGGR